MIEIGQVIAVEKDLATVKFEQKSACGKCNICHNNNDGSNNIELTNNSGAKVGDFVEVAISSKRITQSALIIFGIPLVTMLLGISIAYFMDWKELYLALTGIGALILGFVAVIIIDKLIAKKKSFNPQIIKIIKTEDIKKSGELL